MRLNPRSFLLFGLAGAFTSVGMAPSPVVLASPPVCQVWVTSRIATHPTIINSATLETSTLNIGRTSWNVAMTPDGSKVYISTDTDVKVIDVSAGYVLSTINEPSFDVAVSPDGTKLLTADWYTDVVKEFSTTTGVQTGRSASTGRNPNKIAVSPDGNNIYIANYNTTPNANITKVATSTFTATNHQVELLSLNPSGVAVSPDGSKLYVVLYGGGTVKEFSTSNLALAPRTAVVAVGSRDVAINSTGTKIYVTSTSGNQVVVIDTSTLAITTTISVGTSPQKLAISPDDRFLFVTNQSSNTVSKIDLSTNSVVDTIVVNDQPFGIAIGPSNCTTVVAAAAVAPAAVAVPETTVAPTTTVTETTTVAPTTIAAAPPSALPKTGSEANGWMVMAMCAVIFGTMLAFRRNQLD